MRLSLLLACTLILALGCDDTRLTPDSGLPPGTDGGPLVDSGLPPGTDGGPPRDAGPPPEPSPLVDPNCVDGQFTESLPDPSVSLADLEASYDSSNPVPFLLGVLERRYSTGRALVEGGTPPQAQCPEGWLIRGTADPMAIYQAMSVVVHECGDGYDGALSTFSANGYYINDSPIQLSCSGGDSVDRGGSTFARNRIRQDEYQQPACPQGGGTFVPECDGYADIYLTADLSGQQGFNLLFEELVQYVNSLATGLAFSPELAGPFSVSERDGLLQFLHYLMRYLRLARLEEPAVYEFLLNSDGGCWRRAMLQVWGRSWLYLQATENMAHLGIRDEWLMGQVMAPELLEEIQRLRDAEGCPAP